MIPYPRDVAPTPIPITAAVTSTITDKASGELVATVTQTTFCRADGGFGGPPRESLLPHKLPERAPDMVCHLRPRAVPLGTAGKWRIDGARPR